MADSSDMPMSDRSDFLGFELVTGHAPAEGAECAIQTLYEGKPKCTCCKNWVDAYPDDLEVPSVEERPETKQKAIVVRMCRNHGSGGAGSEEGKPLVLDSIVVQSEVLKKTLGEVFEGYRGITASLKKLVFKAPFHPFHYRWHRFGSILERQRVEDPVAAGYSQILHDLLRSELDYAMSEIRDMTDNGVITYAKLWAIFEPGQHVIKSTTIPGGGGQRRQILVVDSSEYKNNDSEPHLCVKARYIDWDGETLGYASKDLKINRFAGTRAVSELGVCPLALHPDREAITAKAVERGAKFRGLCGVHHKAYSGKIEYKATRRDWTIGNVDGRIMIDAAVYGRENSSDKLTVTPLHMATEMPELSIGDDSHEGKAPASADPAGPPKETDDNYVDPDKTGNKLSDNQLMLCNSVVRGYSLKLNRWAKFEVDGVSEVAWNDGAFSGLVLPEGYSDLLLSFVEAHHGTSPSDGDGAREPIFDDIIEGKGLGTIVLLAGNPGTGKTLTAEAVADHVRRPLYSLNAGGLGQRASAVETKLQLVLELTEKWNAILLFDECDVFMQKRTIDNLRHNEIVAVSLRILEYYRGILFMTSNRVEMIDRAFESRINLVLRYPDLEPLAREHIWRQLSARVGGGETALTDLDFDRLKGIPLNGREIKNAVKNAAMLAARRGDLVGLTHIRTVLAATQVVDVTGI